MKMIRVPWRKSFPQETQHRYLLGCHSLTCCEGLRRGKKEKGSESRKTSHVDALLGCQSLRLEIMIDKRYRGVCLAVSCSAASLWSDFE